VNANTLINLLLELNIVNTKDIDAEINKLASTLADPRAEKWFRRVPRFFLINIDRLLKEPYVAKAEMRKPRSSKYYYDPRGGWRKNQAPAEPDSSPVPVREEYDPEKQTYTTNLHQPAVQRDIEQSFRAFNPAKAKVRRLLGEPPVKKELQPWMTTPDAKAKEFYHFNPIQVRRRELFQRLISLTHYLNYLSRLIEKPPEDDQEKVGAIEAEKTMRRLEVMKTDDIAGFRDLLREGADFHQRVREKPWLFTRDGQLIARHDRLTLRKAVFTDTVVALSKRLSAENTVPSWCTKGEGMARTYADQGPLYFVDKDDKPYVLAHFESSQVRNLRDGVISDAVAQEIAPVFSDPARFPYALLKQGSEALARYARAAQQRRQ